MNGNKARASQGEVLFIDTSELGFMVNRRSREFTDEEIRKIAETYHEWKKQEEQYPKNYTDYT